MKLKHLLIRKEDIFDDALSLQLKTHMPSWENKSKEDADLVAIGNNTLQYNSSGMYIMIL